MRHVAAFFIILPATVLLIDSHPTWARGAVRSVAVVRTDTAPAIDGKLDDACWEQANVTSDFIDYRSENLAEEQTFVRVLYDDENLYVAFECLEPDHNSIVAIERKYDQSLHEEDTVSARVDTFHEHRCAYVFAVNTLGTRFDARMALFRIGRSEYDDTWGCDWSAACSVGQDRWFAEMAIPIGNLLFERKNNVTWGPISDGTKKEGRKAVIGVIAAARPAILVNTVT